MLQFDFMNRQFNAESYRQVRTIAQFDGPLVALKYIRTFHVETFSVAKMVLNDILTNKRWTMPQIKADINGVRERLSLNFKTPTPAPDSIRVR